MSTPARRGNGVRATVWLAMSPPAHKLVGRVAATLVVLAVVILLVGCGGSGAGSTTSVLVTTTTPGRTAPPASPGHAATTAGASAAGASRPSSPPLGGRLLRRFTGSGNARVGTIAMHTPSVLVWSAQHPKTQIFTSSGFILVDSGATSGAIQLPAGTYSGVRVASHGDWSIELRSRS